MPLVAEFLQANPDVRRDAELMAYLCFHDRRFDYLMEKVEAVLRAHPRLRRILDVGPSLPTWALRERHPEIVVNTGGFADPRFPARPQDRHFEFDLNDAQTPGLLPAIEEHDFILMSEVLEHLHTSPVMVLREVSRWLRPGGFMLLQTPNPVSLGKRLDHLRGKNPFEIIREDRRNPGHFCEYRIEDLREISRAAGLEVTGAWLENYFGRRRLRVALYEMLCRILPGNLRDGITVLLRKPGG